MAPEASPTAPGDAPGGPTAETPEIAVVVCSYNRAGPLARCLAALERLEGHERAEFVVVIDGSRDDSAAVAARHDVRVVVHEENRGLSAARNTGIAATHAPIVAFTDDDCLADPGWLTGLLAGYDRPEVVGVGGPASPAEVTGSVQAYLAAHDPLGPQELELEKSGSLPYRLFLYLRRAWAPPPAPRQRAVLSFAGANMSFRRSALEAAGGFDPATRFGGDDEYISKKVRAATAGELWFNPDAVVRHDYPGTVRDVWRRNAAYGRAHARAYLSDDAKRWPIVFPGPLLLLGAFALGRRRGLAAALAVGALVYPHGAKAALRERAPGRLVFSLLRLVEEAAHDAGMAEGLGRALIARAGTANAGTENAGTENAGTENAGTENAGTENAGTENAGAAKES